MHDGRCQGCRGIYHITRAGLVAKHGRCTGGGRKPCPATDLLEERLAATVADLAIEKTYVHATWLSQRMTDLIDQIITNKAEVAGADGEPIRAAYKALQGFLEGLRKLFWLAEKERKYGHCRVCGRAVDDTTRAWAERKIEPAVCSNECQLIETFKRHGCCERGKPIPCVCTHSWECPEHGAFHIGTHD